MWKKYTSFNAWARYFEWNFKGYLWNSTQHILPIHWKIWFLHTTKILRAFRFKSSYAFLKHPLVSSGRTSKLHVSLPTNCWVIEDLWPTIKKVSTMHPATFPPVPSYLSKLWKPSMAADGLATQGARASAVIILTWFSQYIPVPVPKGLRSHANYLIRYNYLVSVLLL